MPPKRAPKRTREDKEDVKPEPPAKKETKKKAAAAKTEKKEIVKKEEPSDSGIAKANDVMDREDFSYDVKIPPKNDANKAIVELLERTAVYKHYLGEAYNTLGLLKGATQYKELTDPLATAVLPRKPRVWADIANEYNRKGGEIKYCDAVKEKIDDEGMTEDKMPELNDLDARQKMFDAVVKECDVEAKPLDDVTLKKIKAVENTLDAYNVKELQAMLRANEQIITGTRAEVVERVSHGKALGAIPKCPKCYGGKLGFNMENGIYYCRGFMDDDEFQPCFWRSTDVTRLPWKDAK